MRNLALSVLALALLAPEASAQTVTVVNMIPATLSNESNQDSEPDLTVNPNDPQEIVASAFTPNPTGVTTSAPVYISQDGGNTWVLNNIVPSANGMTADITVTLSRNNVLYAGILRGGGSLDMRILRSNTYLVAGTMNQLLGRTQEDQPYARSYAPMGGAQRNNDHLYVGHNDWNNLPQSASFEQSLDAATATAPAGLATIRLERRTPFDQDGPPIRQAIHPDGTVYAVYTQSTAFSGTSSNGVVTGNVVVVRDDDWGQGATPYSDLTGADTQPGRFVVSGVSWVWNTGSALGQERLGDRASIAVDPTDSQTVYVAWADRPSGVTGNTATLHVRISTDGGTNWGTDLLTIANAISPQLAVNIRGDVGFLYQQVTGTGTAQRWETHFRQSTTGGTAWNDVTLADTPANNPTRVFGPYIGDYAGLTAVGKDFYGVFSASNIPDNANFPNGVTYQRGANFGTNTLTDGMGGTVAVSIDPFFFRIGNQDGDEDFYVRDWTDSSTVHDVGLEPSTDPWFFNTSDVWNRRSNSSGGFTASDRPISEDPQPTTLGDNFAFARVHRKATGPAETVTLHFLKSEFGTGSNYQAANTTADPTLSFSAISQVETLASGYQWPLNATTSSHTCLAVEISTATDPIVAPSLLGRAPGWPDTDLMVIYDNNKAQRNMGVYTDSGSGEGSSIDYWGLVHNAATFRRDLILDLEVNERFRRLFKKAEVRAIGGELSRDGDRLELLGMAPGENRWVSLTVPVSGQREEGDQVEVSFSEIVDDLPVNGFTIAVERAPFRVASADSLRLLATNLHRLGHVLGLEEALQEARDLGRELAHRKHMDKKWGKKWGKKGHTWYRDRVTSIQPQYREWVDVALERAANDPFGLSDRMASLAEAVDAGGAERILAEQANLDHAVDAFLTYLDKAQGDLADVAQDMRWLGALARQKAPLQGLPGVDLDELAELSEEFDRGYASRRLTAEDFPRFVQRALPQLRKIDAALALGQQDTLDRIESSLEDPRAVQKAHREILLRLEDLQ